MIKNRNIDNAAAISPTKILGGAGSLGVGEIMYVCQSTNTTIYDWLTERIPSANFFTTVQAALTACVARRNDYVVVWPDTSTYDHTSALTMSKANVHLIAPGGMRDVGANQSVILEQSTADTAIISVTGSDCEIAGFRFYNSAAATLLSTTGMICGPTANYGHAVHIHNNNFEITASGADNEPFINAYNSGTFNRCDIHHNIMRIPNPSTTMAYGCYLSTAYGYFHHNVMIVQNGATITWGVRMNGSGGLIAWNDFVATRAGGGLSAGAFGGAILIDTNDQTAAIGNRGACPTGTFIEGGTADTSWSDNRGAVNGGSTPVDQDADA